MSNHTFQVFDKEQIWYDQDNEEHELPEYFYSKDEVDESISPSELSSESCHTEENKVIESCEDIHSIRVYPKDPVDQLVYNLRKRIEKLQKCVDAWNKFSEESLNDYFPSQPVYNEETGSIEVPY